MFRFGKIEIGKGTPSGVPSADHLDVKEHCMTTDDAAQRLVDYIKSRPGFVYHKVDPPYGHMGATIADSLLQANNRYSSVTPRVRRILARWPRENTVTAVLDVLKSVPAVQFLNWNGKDRADRFCEVLLLLKREGVESESDFRTWLGKETNLSKLRSVHGIGPKTVDYFRLMVGLQGAAIDRRLLKFLGMAGIQFSQSDYATALAIINRAADLASVPRADFDHSIWRYVGDHVDSACA
jgi:hypothetical protein